LDYWFPVIGKERTSIHRRRTNIVYGS